MNPEKKAYFYLHIAVLLFGFTALFGRLVSVSEFAIVWWRLLITCLSLPLFANVFKHLKTLSRGTVLRLLGIGWVVAFHWVFFFGAVKYSNVSVTLVCLSTAAFFTSILEPIVTQKKIQWYELALGLLIIPGMALIVRDVDTSMYTGIVLALLSAVFAAVFTVLNKVQVANVDPPTMTFVELGSGLILLSFLYPVYNYFFEATTFWPQGMDWAYLIFLALFCTSLAFVFALKALQHLSAFTSNITINLEPVYGIILAWFIFQEYKELGPYFYVGMIIILISVLTYPLLKRKFAKVED